MRLMWLRSGIPWLLSASVGAGIFVWVSSCGKNTLKDVLGGSKIGAVAGKFDLRLADYWRDKIDQVQAKIDSLIPNSSSTLAKRFDDDEEIGTSGNKLSDLFKLEFNTTSVGFVNKEIFSLLANAEKDGQKNIRSHRHSKVSCQ